MAVAKKSSVLLLCPAAAIVPDREHKVRVHGAIDFSQVRCLCGARGPWARTRALSRQHWNRMNKNLTTL